MKKIGAVDKNRVVVELKECKQLAHLDLFVFKSTAHTRTRHLI